MWPGPQRLLHNPISKASLVSRHLCKLSVLACTCRLVHALLQRAQTADSSDPASWQQAFTQAYDLGARLVGTAQPVLPVQLDEALSQGHLMRTCLEQGRLAAAPGAGEDPHSPGVLCTQLDCRQSCLHQGQIMAVCGTA